MQKSVWLFTEGKAKDNALLGNKGANLHEMIALDLPVPFGFIFTTKTCIEYNRLGGKLPDGVMNRVMRNYRKLRFTKAKSLVTLKIRCWFPSAPVLLYQCLE